MSVMLSKISEVSGLIKNTKAWGFWELEIDFKHWLGIKFVDYI